jgi:hypothetical protein
MKNCSTSDILPDSSPLSPHDKGALLVSNRKVGTKNTVLQLKSIVKTIHKKYFN